MSHGKVLRLPAVMEATGLAKPTIYKYISLNKFPPGMRSGVARVRIWPEADIYSWVRGEWQPTPGTEAAA